MKSALLKWLALIQGVLLPYGPWGMLLIALLDSALVPLPQAVDVLVITFCLRNPDIWPLYAAMATLGSLAGCLILYYIAQAGGHAFLERKVGAARAEQIRNRFERYEFLTVMVPAILPPPVPLKAFVITAGVLEVHLGKFLLALLLGRTIRYFGEGYLAVRYGQAVWQYMTREGQVAALVVLGVVLLVILVVRVVRRRG